MVKTLWLENGDDELVLIKVDLIYSFDGLVTEVTKRLQEHTGRDLAGQVIITASHSHNAFGPFSDQPHFYLGGDYFNQEIFERTVDTIVTATLDAFDTKQPVSIGAAWEKDWDPSNAVYRDRRSDNNDLVIWDDQDPDYNKDPYLYLMRIDATDGEPLAVLFSFGIHGTVLDADNTMISVDSTGHIEMALEDAFDSSVVVMHLQSATGDLSPAGMDDHYARLESLGARATPSILALWEQTATSEQAISLQTVSRHIWQHHAQIKVTRAGTVDWTYKPYEEGYVADNEIYDASGTILSPIDEFNTPYGAAFCGDDFPFVPNADVGSTIYPYSSCTQVDVMTRLLTGFFKLEQGSIEAPLFESYKAGTTASRLGPILTRTHEGEEINDDMLFGFFPGEPTSLYTEQWRRRVRAELGYEQTLLVGYAQDHEGYLLLPEDWLMGGYEPNINVWGPLQAEHIMEGVLDYAGLFLSTDVHEDPDPWGYYAPTRYPERPLPSVEPDLTPQAGVFLDSVPEYLWAPLEMAIDFSIQEHISRVQGVVQIAFNGGDPGVDTPLVTLQRLEEGQWSAVVSPSGRPITSARPDILLAHTPEPLYPLEAEQQHLWWAAWQAIGPSDPRQGLPLGTYRLHVEGQRYIGGASSWPWPTEPYELDSPSFEVLPAVLSINILDDGLTVSAQGPADGWRLISLDGNSRSDNPVQGPVSIEFDTPAGLSHETFEIDELRNRASFVAISIPEDATSITVTDVHGNSGSQDL